MGEMKNWKKVRRNGILKWVKERIKIPTKKGKNIDEKEKDIRGKEDICGKEEDIRGKEEDIRRREKDIREREKDIREKEDIRGKEEDIREKEKDICRKEEDIRGKEEDIREKEDIRGKRKNISVNGGNTGEKEELGKKLKQHRKTQKPWWQNKKKELHDRFSQIKWRFGLYVPLCICLAMAGSFLIGMATNYLQDWSISQQETENAKLEDDYGLYKVEKHPEYNYDDKDGQYSEYNHNFEDGQFPEYNHNFEDGQFPEYNHNFEDGQFSEYNYNFEDRQYSEYNYEIWYDHDGVLHYDFAVEAEKNGAMYDFLSFLQFLLIPIWILFSVYLTGRLFYSRELKTPIHLLLNASKRIADNQLDFKLEYDKPNEFGILCRAFDEMRSALYDSNRQLWRSLEERKRLNAAFSHDLRTPLTVLRGYADFLKKYIPGGNVSEEKLLEVLGMMSGQIVRLEHYTQTMNSVQKLSDIVPHIEPIASEQIKNSFLRTGELLCEGKRFELKWRGDVLFWFDTELVFQIYENLVSNACRYAAECVSVTCAVEGGMFLFIVSDDGKGFGSEALRHAAEPFFRDEQEPDKTHFGLGLYICRILCEKCGGMLNIGNVVDENGAVRGGKVTAMVACGE